MKWHHQLEKLLVIKGQLILETGLHCGSALPSGSTNAGVIRDAFGHPVLPGSSLKGAVRSRVAALAHGITEKPCCHLVKTRDLLRLKDDTWHKPDRCLSTYQDGAAWIQEHVGDGAKPLSIESLSTNLCAICKLFGGASWRGAVTFDDLILDLESLPITEVRDGVGLDRDTRLAVPGVKYSFESLPPGTRFYFRCTAENLGDEGEALLAAGLLELCHGHLPLGGKVTRGLGSARLDPVLLTITSTDFKKVDDCLHFFSGTQASEDPNPPMDLLQLFIDRVTGRHHAA